MVDPSFSHVAPPLVLNSETRTRRLVLVLLGNTTIQVFMKLSAYCVWDKLWNKFWVISMKQLVQWLAWGRCHGSSSDFHRSEPLFFTSSQLISLPGSHYYQSLMEVDFHWRNLTHMEKVHISAFAGFNDGDGVTSTCSAITSTEITNVASMTIPLFTPAPIQLVVALHEFEVTRSEQGAGEGVRDKARPRLRRSGAGQISSMEVKVSRK